MGIEAFDRIVGSENSGNCMLILSASVTFD